jgi:hypothetical protein
VLRSVRDPYLPLDRDAFVAAEPPTGRIIVVAPTRAACETIELAIGLHLETFLEREHGEDVRRLASSGKGFGIVAGTGTGKTLAIRIIAERILGTELRVGVVNREREATPETPTWNVIVVTTGIARRWFQDGDIQPQDTLIVDEIHQTSAELELVLALGKRIHCRYIWLSATVDPTFYARYLESAEVIQSFAFDPERAAKVTVLRRKPIEFLDENFLRQVQRERRGVAVFLPTRAGVEQAADHVQRRAPRINAAFYHGGEPIRVVRPYLEGEGQRRPYLLAMTAAGQSALNVRGLDTVVIDDVRFTNIIDRGRNVLTQTHLGANEILQMAGRVHGRVEGGRVFILSDRDIRFDALRPTEPEFQLAGDSERVAMTCADIGVNAEELELPVPLDRVAYRNAIQLLRSRGIIEESGRLSQYGRAVEAMPVDRNWAELLVHSEDDLLPYVAVMSSFESLHRMTREDRNLEGLVVPGSDHLTGYNVYAEAFTRCGYVGEVYGLPRHLFDDSIQDWAEERGVLVKSLEDIALGMASVYRATRLPLPTKLPLANDAVHRRFAELLASIMPFDLVIDERSASGDEVRVSKTSVSGSWGAIAGEIRYFADRQGIPRAAIEGTQIPYELIRKFATRGDAELVYNPNRKHGQLALKRVLSFFGFELDRELESIDDEFPPELAPKIRRLLAEGLARFDARHVAVKRNRVAIEELREVHRRSGGTTPKMGTPELTEIYERLLQPVSSVSEFRAAPLYIDADDFVPADERERLLALPDRTTIRDREVEIRYELDDNGKPIARLRLPEKLARHIGEEELPKLDRPIQFAVHRAQRKSIRAATLGELREELARPWSEDDMPEPREREESRPARAREEFKRGDRGRNGRHRSRHEEGGPKRGGGRHRGGSRRRRGP